jgi:hypothetical protein
MSTTPSNNMACNLSVLSHAVELATKTVLRVAGADAADTVHGAQITEEALADAVAARIQVSLAPQVGA